MNKKFYTKKIARMLLLSLLVSCAGTNVIESKVFAGPGEKDGQSSNTTEKMVEPEETVQNSSVTNEPTSFISLIDGTRIPLSAPLGPRMPFFKVVERSYNREEEHPTQGTPISLESYYSEEPDFIEEAFVFDSVVPVYFTQNQIMQPQNLASKQPFGIREKWCDETRRKLNGFVAKGSRAQLFLKHLFGGELIKCKSELIKISKEVINNANSFGHNIPQVNRDMKRAKALLIKHIDNNLDVLAPFFKAYKNSENYISLQLKRAQGEKLLYGIWNRTGKAHYVSDVGDIVSRICDDIGVKKLPYDCMHAKGLLFPFIKDHWNEIGQRLQQELS